MALGLFFYSLFNQGLKVNMELSVEFEMMDHINDILRWFLDERLACNVSSVCFEGLTKFIGADHCFGFIICPVHCLHMLDSRLMIKGFDFPTFIWLITCLS